MSLGSFKAVAADGFKAPCDSGSQGWIVVLLKGKGKHKGRPLCSPVLPATLLPGVAAGCPSTLQQNSSRKAFRLQVSFYITGQAVCNRHGITLMDL